MSLVYVSGRPGLDLLGTRKWRRTAEAEEQLSGPTVLSDWARGSGLVDEAVVVSARELSQAIELREALYRVVRARIAGRPCAQPDVELVNAHARRHPVTPELLPDGLIRRRATTRQLLATVALDTLDLLAGTDLDRVRECASPDCTRLYVDTSRSRSRRWCGMTECGNRAKAQTFRQRHRTTSH
ncbi:MAG: ABATE domain-containing protein [Jatrophihabitantaceae bacterium]